MLLKRVYELPCDLAEVYLDDLKTFVFFLAGNPIVGTFAINI
jgi:hypothetical protein